MEEPAAAAPSPALAQVAWGRIALEDGRTFKDAKLFPGGARDWDWTETGTRHDPGVQPADLEELLERGARVVVLSRGQWSRLRVPEATLAWLAERGVAAEAHETRRAAERYEALRTAGEPVAALLHSTC